MKDVYGVLKYTFKILVVVVVLVVPVLAFFLYRSLGQSLSDIFNGETVVTVTYKSEINEIQAVNDLVVTNLTETALFTLEETKDHPLVPGPPQTAKVQISVPVTYIYKLDLGGVWQVERKGKQIKIIHPNVVCGDVVLDMSKEREEIVQTTIASYEDVMLRTLRNDLSRLAHEKGQEKKRIAKPKIDEGIVRFFKRWVSSKYDGGDIEEFTYVLEEAEIRQPG